MKATEEESGQIKKWQEKVRQRDARIKKLLKEIEELRARKKRSNATAQAPIPAPKDL